MLSPEPAPQKFYAVIYAHSHPMHYRRVMAVKSFPPETETTIVTAPSLVEVTCKKPRFTKSGKPSKTNAYIHCKTLRGIYTTHSYSVHSSEGEFFVDIADAEAAFASVSSVYDAQEATFKALQDECTARVRELVKPLVELVLQFPEYLGFQRHVVTDYHGVLTNIFRFTLRERQLHMLAFTDEPDIRSWFTIPMYPQTLGFDPDAYVEFVNQEVSRMTGTFTRFLTYLRDHAGALAEAFPDGFAPNQYELKENRV